MRAWQVAYTNVFPRAALDRLADEEAQRTWRARIESLPNESHILVADVDDRVVGFVSAGPAFDAAFAGSGEVYAVYVQPEAWGRGIGRSLMAEALDRMRGMGLNDAILWVLEDNRRTRRFYELGGWHLDGAPKEDNFLDTLVVVVRYRIALEP